jgi:hypothetical protein
MKKKDIKVGQKYTHNDYPGVVYLGVGRINRENMRHSDKNLVIITTRTPWDCLGHIVGYNNLGFWDEFVEMKVNNS